jgi:hypothetical protein
MYIWEQDSLVIGSTAAGRMKTSRTGRTRSTERFVRLEVLTAASTKMAVLRVVQPCSLVEVYRRFRGACYLHHQGDRPDDVYKV